MYRQIESAATIFEEIEKTRRGMVKKPVSRRQQNEGGEPGGCRDWQPPEERRER